MIQWGEYNIKLNLAAYAHTEQKYITFPTNFNTGITAFVAISSTADCYVTKGAFTSNGCNIRISTIKAKDNIEDSVKWIAIGY